MLNVGSRFGRLVIMGKEPKDAKGNLRSRCQCECGRENIVRDSELRDGSTRSCGCLRREIGRKRAKATGEMAIAFRHGATSYRKEIPIYRCWKNMKARCLWKKHKSWKYYGGRGIQICARWLNSFEAFLEDMGDQPGREFSIDRIDPSGNYEPGNCRWATPKEQCRNRSITRMVETKTGAAPLAQLAEEAGLAVETLRRRLSRGWSIERAISKIGSR